jgi:hypothetical protein
MQERLYTSRRFAILTALAEKLKEINGEGDYRTKLWDNVKPKLEFWDELEEFPAVRMSLGPEYREFLGGGAKNRFLTVTIRCYIKEEDPQNALEALLEDIETVIEQNGRLAYQDSSGVPQSTQDILVSSIDTDEGALDPIAVGELSVQIRY